MNTKKNVLRVSSGYIVYLTSLFLVSVVCYSNWCRIHDDDLLGRILFFFAPLFPIFFLSLITYRMKDEVFQAWWGFARWWVPVIIVVTLLLENAGGGGTLGMNKDFTAFILIILYSILIITSLVKIVNAYLKTRG
ncbi:MAG: hypothetical protein Q7T37_01860 [bacterium]|nr:hypothetical protein [bacterium]MDO8742777.1 hypothetical protein [bacterium]